MLAAPIRIAAIALPLTAGALPVMASHGEVEHLRATDQLPMGLIMPEMNAERGRALFVNKGCIVCHSVNGVGGEDAQALDTDTMEDMMNPFDFAARMWRGSAAMVELQKKELGEQIELNGQELADIIAFVHDAREQAKLTRDQIPEGIARMMHHDIDEDHSDESEMEHQGEEEKQSD